MRSPDQNQSEIDPAHPSIDRYLLFRLWIIAGVSLLPLLIIKLGLWPLISFSLFMVGLRATRFELLVFAAFIFALLSIMSALFLIWTFWGRYQPTLPKRTVCLWALLCAIYPWQIYYYFNELVPNFPLEIRQYLNDYPVVYLFEFADGALLIWLGVWIVKRRLQFFAGEKLWFHWLLFVAICWSLRNFQVLPIGFSIS